MSEIGTINLDELSQEQLAALKVALRARLKGTRVTGPVGLFRSLELQVNKTLAIVGRILPLIDNSETNTIKLNTILSRFDIDTIQAEVDVAIAKNADRAELLSRRLAERKAQGKKR